MNRPRNLQLDKRNILYLDDQDIVKKELHLARKGFDDRPVSTFYSIEENLDYIIKINYYRPLFYDLKIKKMIEHFSELEKYLSKVDLPIAYYQSNGKVLGTVIPYYPDTVNIRYLFGFNPERLFEFYKHDENVYRNLLSMYLDILDILKEMYENGMCYMDIRSTNFVFHQNDVKIIDFEPSELHFNNKNLYYHKIIKSFCLLINAMSMSVNAKELTVPYVNTFKESEDEIKRLYKRI